MEEELDDDILDVLEVDGQSKEVYSKEKKTPPIMWWNEKSKIISKRIKQLDSGKKTTIPEIVSEKKLFKSYDIAMKEFETGKLPAYYLKRRLRNGVYELWKHNDFKFYPQ